MIYMTQLIEKQLKKEVRHASRLMGINENEIVRRALVLYLRSIQNHISLRDELNAWDVLSDEALHSTEQELQTIS